MTSGAMSLAVPEASSPVRLAEPIDLPSELQEAESAGYLPVRLDDLGQASRGRLAFAIVEAIERTLAERGASPSGVAGVSSLELALADQLYRARLIEHRGIALALNGLRNLASLSGVLDAEDSAVIRWWFDASERAPIRLFIDRASATLGVYGPPRPLAELLQRVRPAVAPTGAVSRETDDAGGAVAMSKESDDEPPALVEAATFPASPEAPEGEAPSAEAQDPLAEAAQEPEPPAPAPRPLYPNARERWRIWTAELSAARGKQPLAAIERMFVSSYVPLCDAALQGFGDRDSEGLLARWAKSFARSYEEAFDALRLRGKRPSMVLDAPEIALRIGRLHGARSVQLLLIDALRFDLGLRVAERVHAALGQQVALAERLVLWSALPTRTEVQVELIGRGPEGLSAPARGENCELALARGRAATSLRRVKTLHRELLKLDLVEARLAEPGPAEAERLDALADEAAPILSDYLARQAPRTLVFAFGDHGFLLERQGDGTRAAREGGSSPEEVLVPAFAWLVGGVH